MKSHPKQRNKSCYWLEELWDMYCILVQAAVAGVTWELKASCQARLTRCVLRGSKGDVISFVFSPGWLMQNHQDGTKVFFPTSFNSSLLLLLSTLARSHMQTGVMPFSAWLRMLQLLMRLCFSWALVARLLSLLFFLCHSSWCKYRPAAVFKARLAAASCLSARLLFLCACVQPSCRQSRGQGEIASLFLDQG